MPRHTKAERFPDRIEELLGFLRRHVASELHVDECPAPLEESLRVYTRAVIAETRDVHEHATPVVHLDAESRGAVGGNSNNETPRFSHDSSENAAKTRGAVERPSEYARPTLPTDPPGVSYEDPPVTGRTSRGFPRVG